MYSIGQDKPEAADSGSLSSSIEAAVAEVCKALLGKEHQIRLALCCLFSGGHLLIEDLPGMGKTTLSHALAITLGLRYNRIQFTSDLLPADILGISVFEQSSSEFRFHPGPVFSQLVLADEINRTTPKTQSALLEAMEERQVSVEGETRPLPDPFFVIATQNPVSLAGTYPLPESQLDRFLMRLQLGYPDRRAERELLEMNTERDRLNAVQQCLSPEGVKRLHEASSKVKTSASLLDYVQRLVEFTRSQNESGYGLSPRGALAILRAARTWALMAGRNHVLPEDVQAILPAVVEHRLRFGFERDSSASNSIVQRLLAEVDVLE